MTDEFGKKVEFYKARLIEFTGRLRRAKTKEECWSILGEKNELFISFLITDPKVLEAQRKQNREFLGSSTVTFSLGTVLFNSTFSLGFCLYAACQENHRKNK